jgi:hypothetical protein
VGSQHVTYQVNGVDYEGQQASRLDTFRLSNFGDATMTSETTNPHAYKLDFKKVSRFPKPLSDRFLRKKERPAEHHSRAGRADGRHADRLHYPCGGTGSQV